MPTVRGTRAGARFISASAMPTTRAANRPADGTPSAVSAPVATTLRAASTTHFANPSHFPATERPLR